VQPGDAVLDIEQLRDVTMNDEGLMREFLGALLDDTARQFRLLKIAIRESDSQKCIRLAHYSKGGVPTWEPTVPSAYSRRSKGTRRKVNSTNAAHRSAGLAGELRLLRSAALTL
jgi:hypothetical protein